MTVHAEAAAPAGAAIVTQALRKVYPPPPAGRRARAGAAGAAATGAAAPPATGAPAAPAAGIVALEALDLEIGAGEFLGLLGPNGAGKTTTIGILTTRVLPTSGRARVGGDDVVAASVRVRQRIGVVPQRANPDRALTVLENLVFHARYFGFTPGVALERGRALLERFELAARADSKVDHLSGGQQQRLMIARALMHAPQALFLDEPTVGLDPQARLALWGVLRELHAEGRTIVMTTHYMEEADQLCERVAIVDQGRLLALDTPAALKARAPGGTLVELTLAGDAEALAAAARALPGVRGVEPRGAVLRAYAERGGEAVAALVRAAEAAGREVRDVHLAPPS